MMIRKILKERRRGATLFEVLVYVALFSIMSIAFMTIFLIVIRVNARQSSAGEVNGQAQFLITTIECNVEQATSFTVGGGGGSVVFTMTTSTVTIALGGSAVQMTDANGTSTLTSSKVTIDSLTFTKRTNAGARDVLSVSFKISSAVPTNSQQYYTRTFQTGFQQLNP